MGTVTGVDIPQAPQRADRPALERILALAPWLVGIALAAVVRLPPTSRLRRRALVEAFSRAFAATNRGDSWYIPLVYEPDCEVYVPAPFQGLGMAAEYRGHAGAQEALDAVNEFLEVLWKPNHLIDLGDKRVVMRAGLSATGDTSGIATHQVYGSVFHFSARGRIARQDQFWTWEETLAAAGLDGASLGGR